MSEARPVDRIALVDPSPSLLTSARDRSRDGFGRGSDPADLPEGLSDAERAALEIDASSAVWRTGISWVPACQPSFNQERCTAPEFTRTDPDPRSTIAVEAFTIYTPAECEWTLRTEQLATDAEELTAQHTANQLAQALWMGEGLPDTIIEDDGTVVLHPTLRAAGVDVTVGASMDLDDAVAALLSQYEQCTGGAGGAVLHVPSVLMPYALGGGAGGATIARKEASQYIGPLGSLVSPGPGYPHGASADGVDGHGPLVDDDPESYKGNALNQAWVFISGPVEYAVSNVRSAGSNLDAGGRGNKYAVWGEREALVRFDTCCVFAALVTNPAGEVS